MDSEVKIVSEEVQESATLGALFGALAKAQGMMKAAKKDAVNPHFRNTYATLDSCWDAIREPLCANELAVIQRTRSIGDSVQLRTRLGHSSGEWIEGTLTLILTSVGKPGDPITMQAQGSALSYARRYGLGMVGVVTDTDDDGNAASELKNHVSQERAAIAQGEAPSCPVHKKPFVEGKYGLYCKSKNEDGSWCKEKPKKEPAQGNDEPPGMEYFDEPEQAPAKRPAEEVQAQVNRIIGLPDAPGIREQAGIDEDTFFAGVEEVYKTRDLWKMSDKARDTIERRLKERIAKAKAE